MVDNQAETRARVVDRGVLQHGVVAITVPTTDDRSPTDELMNSDWLASIVIHEQVVESFCEHWAAVP